MAAFGIFQQGDWEKSRTLVAAISSINIRGSGYLQPLQLHLQLSSLISLRSRCRPSVGDQTFRTPCRSTSIGGFEKGSRTHSVDILNWPLRTCGGTFFTPAFILPQLRHKYGPSAPCVFGLEANCAVSSKGSLFSLLYLHQVSSSSRRQKFHHV